MPMKSTLSSNTFPYPRCDSTCFWKLLISSPCSAVLHNNSFALFLSVFPSDLSEVHRFLNWMDQHMDLHRGNQIFVRFPKFDPSWWDKYCSTFFHDMSISYQLRISVKYTELCPENGRLGYPKVIHKPSVLPSPRHLRSTLMEHHRTIKLISRRPYSLIENTIWHNLGGGIHFKSFIETCAHIMQRCLI